MKRFVVKILSIGGSATCYSRSKICVFIIVCAIIVTTSSCTLHAFDGKAPLFCFSRSCFKEKMQTRKKGFKSFFKILKVKKDRQSNEKKQKQSVAGGKRDSSLKYDTTIVITTFNTSDTPIDKDSKIASYLKANKSRIKSVTVQSYYEKSGLFNKKQSKRRKKSVCNFIKESKISSKRIFLNRPIKEGEPVTHKVDVFIDLK